MSIATFDQVTESVLHLRPVAEMRAYLERWRKDADAKRHYSELLSVEAAQDIHADIEREQSAVCAIVAGEETESLRNASEIEAILADGEVGRDEIAQLRKLARRERTSATHLHSVTERMAT